MSYQEFRPRSFQTLPPVIKNLLIINILMFAATWVLENRMKIDLVEILGLHYISAPHFKPFQFLTYLFMHGNISHLFFNMFAVWMFGSTLENVWGSKRFLIYYLVTGFGAALIQYCVFYLQINPIVDAINQVQNDLTIQNFEDLVNSAQFQNKLSYEFYGEYSQFVGEYNSLAHSAPEKALSLASQFLISFKNHYLNSHVVIGASGALFGLLLAFGMMFPNTLLYLYFFVPVKAKWFVIGYGALELFSGLQSNPEDNVAHFAHLGGMLFGLILILIWKRNRTFFY
jgi:membrane associated rhomboid family serine protease